MWTETEIPTGALTFLVVLSETHRNRSKKTPVEQTDEMLLAVQIVIGNLEQFVVETTMTCCTDVFRKISNPGDTSCPRG